MYQFFNHKPNTSKCIKALWQKRIRFDKAIYFRKYTVFYNFGAHLLADHGL